MAEGISLHDLDVRLRALEIVVVINTIMSSTGASVEEVVELTHKRSEAWKRISEIAGEDENGSAEVAAALGRLAGMLKSFAETMAEDQERD